MWELLRSISRPVWTTLVGLSVLVTLLLGYLYLREPLDELMGRCVPAGAALARVAFVGGLVLSVTVLFYLILAKVRNRYLDLRDDRPATQRFRDSLVQMNTCGKALAWAGISGSTEDLARASAEVQQLSLTLNELHIRTPPTERLDLWKGCLARLKVLAR